MSREKPLQGKLFSLFQVFRAGVKRLLLVKDLVPAGRGLPRDGHGCPGRDRRDDIAVRPRAAAEVQRRGGGLFSRGGCDVDPSVRADPVCRADRRDAQRIPTGEGGGLVALRQAAVPDILLQGQRDAVFCAVSPQAPGWLCRLVVCFKACARQRLAQEGAVVSFDNGLLLPGVEGGRYPGPSPGRGSSSASWLLSERRLRLWIFCSCHR